jgi:hypothetical protein
MAKQNKRRLKQYLRGWDKKYSGAYKKRKERTQRKKLINWIKKLR